MVWLLKLAPTVSELIEPAMRVGREDLAVATIDAASLSPDIPVLPLDTGSDAVAVGKTVVSMGYPNGPDRLLAMVDDAEAKSINARFGGSRQALITFLAQTRKIVPLTTQGSITDLDERRIVHDDLRAPLPAG